MGASLASHSRIRHILCPQGVSRVSESNAEEDLRVQCPWFLCSVGGGGIPRLCRCGLHSSDHEEALERHIYRCTLGAVKYFMHRGLAHVVARILRQAGAAKTDIVFEVMSNLRE